MPYHYIRHLVRLFADRNVLVYNDVSGFVAKRMWSSLGVALHTDACELQSKLSDGAAQEERNAIRFVIRGNTPVPKADADSLVERCEKHLKAQEEEAAGREERAKQEAIRANNDSSTFITRYLMCRIQALDKKQEPLSPRPSLSSPSISFLFSRTK